MVKKLSNMNMSKRDVTLDFTKGVLILLVVLGHSIQYSFGPEYNSSKLFFSNIAFKAIYAFHMPLFMMISGYLFYNSNKKDINTLLRSKLISIGIPLLSFVLLCRINGYIPCLKEGKIVKCIALYLDDVFCGMTMWYLFSLLLNIVVLSIITRLIKQNSNQIIAMILLFIVSFFISDTIILSVHKFMYPFFCIGYFINVYKFDLYNYSGNNMVLFFLTLISVGLLFWFNYETYIYTTGFCISGHYTIQLFINFKRIIIALIISYTFMLYMKRITMSRLFGSYYYVFFRNLGQMSLFIYGFNIFFDMVYSKIMSFLSLSFNPNCIMPLLFTAFVIGFSVFLYNIIEKNRILKLLFLGRL